MTSDPRRELIRLALASIETLAATLLGKDNGIIIMVLDPDDFTLSFGTNLTEEGMLLVLQRTVDELEVKALTREEEVIQ